MFDLRELIFRLEQIRLTFLQGATEQHNIFPDGRQAIRQIFVSGK